MSITKATDGLSELQLAHVNHHLAADRSYQHYGGGTVGTPLEHWSIYRMPTTVHPPTHLALHWRNEFGKLVKVIVITENGHTKPFTGK